MPYYFAVLPGPPFQVAQKSGQKSSNDGKVRELYLPVEHLVLSRVRRLGRPQYPSTPVEPTSPFRVIRQSRVESRLRYERPASRSGRRAQAKRSTYQPEKGTSVTPCPDEWIIQPPPR